MTGDPPIADQPLSVPAPRRRTGRLILIAMLAAFALGVMAMFAAWPAIERWRSPPLAAPLPAVPAPVVPTVTAAAPITMEGLAAREAALDAQLRLIEARMAAADNASRTAASYATRAEAMMIAFAARRALDRGLALGYVESELRARFGADEPQAVATIVSAAQSPVTLEDLRAGLDANAPRLTTGTAAGGVWRAIGRELGNLVILRRDTSPSPRPSDRLTRARRMLDAGHVEGALAEVARLPGAVEVASWTEAAKRYVEARRALNALELAAINGRSAPAVAPPAGQTPVPALVAPAPTAPTF